MRRSIHLVIALVVCFPLAAENVSPEMLWNALITGNKQFAGGKITYDQLQDERAHLKAHQSPPVTVLSCSDSRVPPELVFNQSIGGLFVIRNAGSVADELGLASIEFAIDHGYTSLIVVLGHENCGAVRASLGAADPGTPSLVTLAQRIRQSFRDVTWNGLDDPANVRKAVEANARASAAWLPAMSSVVRNAVIAGKVKIVPAYYSLETGLVTKVE